MKSKAVEAKGFDKVLRAMLTTIQSGDQRKDPNAAESHAEGKASWPVAQDSLVAQIYIARSNSLLREFMLYLRDMIIAQQGMTQ